MNQPLAKRACERCRARRVKCDKSLSTCHRCSKLGKDCPGYPARKTFFDDGAKIRKKLDKSSNASIPSPSLHQLSLDNANEASEIHCHTDSTGSTTENPPSDHQNSIAVLLGDFDHDFLHDDIASNPLSGDDYFNLDLESYYANGNNACGFIPGIPAILIEVDESLLDDLDTSNLWSHDSTRSKSPTLSSEARSANKAVGRDLNQETAILLRHFVEVMAPVMDIYDTNAYFGRIVPLKVPGNKMLHSAIAAVAAKHIARKLQQNLPLSDRTDFQPLTLSSHNAFEGMDSHQWFYKAASHYDKGLSYLRIQLQKLSSFTTINLSSPELDSCTPIFDGHSMAGNSTTTPPSSQDVRAVQMEDLLTAISILTLYEDFEVNSDGLSQHLDGLNSLFGQSIPYYGIRTKSPTALFDSRRGGHAAFWYCAHQDIYSAYNNRSFSRLDPKDTQLWSASGICPTLISVSVSTVVDGDIPFFDPSWCENEHAASQCLIWLTLKVIDFIAPRHCESESGTSVSLHKTPPIPIRSPDRSPQSIYGRDKSQEWALLHNLLQEWRKNLPITFRPYASISLDLTAENESTSFEKVFFTMPIVAAAMQMYHFAQVLLLLNRPLDQESNLNPSKLLKIFHQTYRDANYHSRQICGIALGNPHLSVKKQMIPSLHLSGLCFDKDSDRQVVLGILRDINTDTNVSTEKQIRELCSEWGWNTDQHAVIVPSTSFAADQTQRAD